MDTPTPTTPAPTPRASTYQAPAPQASTPASAPPARGSGGRRARKQQAPFLALAAGCLLIVLAAALPSAMPGAGSAERPFAAHPSVPHPQDPPHPATPAIVRGELRGLAVDGGRLVWNGLHAGMSRSQVATVLAGELPPVRPNPVGWCGEYETTVEVAGRRALLAFDGPGESAELQSVTLWTAPAPGAAGSAAPEQRTESATGTPPAEDVRLAALPDEAPPAATVFATAAGELLLAEPGAGVSFGRLCID